MHVRVQAHTHTCVCVCVCVCVHTCTYGWVGLVRYYFRPDNFSRSNWTIHNTVRRLFDWGWMFAPQQWKQVKQLLFQLYSLLSSSLSSLSPPQRIPVLISVCPLLCYISSTVHYEPMTVVAGGLCAEGQSCHYLICVPNINMKVL